MTLKIYERLANQIEPTIIERDVRKGVRDETVLVEADTGGRVGGGIPSRVPGCRDERT